MPSWKTGKPSSKTTGMEIVFNGIISGVVLALLIGPVFFTILQTSIERGFNSGFFVAIGVSLSDAFYILVSYLGLVPFVTNGSTRHYLAYGGALVLFGFGIYYLFIKSRKLSNFNPATISARSPGRLIAKGFIINGLSPMVLFFWVATVGVATTQFGYTSPREILTYFSSIVLTVFVTDLMKAKLADKLRLLITPRFIRILNIVLGIVLVVFACRLIMNPEHVPH
jgi:threonine/homoserine/homoserine lactone efflux protein